MGDSMFYCGLRRNDHGEWVLDYEDSGRIACCPVTRENLEIHRADLIKQLELLRQCATEKGWNRSLRDSPVESVDGVDYCSRCNYFVGACRCQP